jgi:DNA adenine methylase
MLGKRKNRFVAPFVKWAGGKAQILAEIRSKYPAGLGTSVTKYAEPFVGGGAVLFDVLGCHRFDEVYIGDVNRELIHTYSVVQNHVNELVDTLGVMSHEYLLAGEDKRKTLYYDARYRFNALKANDSNGIEIAALFIFLNRTCFNGLYRVNHKGEYNVPQGNYKNPRICDTDNLRSVSDKLKNVQIVGGDYKLSREFIDDRTFAYFDPPYRPLTATSNFTAYAEGGFGDKEQTELAMFIDEMSERGAWCVASNSDPRNADENDDFFDRLYAKHSILRIEATRAINSVASGRGCVRELLIARG